jgi:type IV pilus assembly protein PilX
MNHNAVLLSRRHHPIQCGFVLIASLLMLLLLTILTLSMGKTFELQEMIAGNQREKIRAFESAETALNYAESWLNLPVNLTNTGITCTAPSATPVVCNNALANPATLPWAMGVSYTPTNMTISSTGGAGTYSNSPMFYIQYLGLGLGSICVPVTTPCVPMYQITALGFGGDSRSVAVLQSIYGFF